MSYWSENPKVSPREKWLLDDLKDEKDPKKILELHHKIKEIQGVYDKTLIIITADHGGKEKNHKENSPLVTTIPWLAVGSQIKENYKISEQVYIYDTAPTVLNALGLPPIPNIDGKVISEIFIK